MARPKKYISAKAVFEMAKIGCTLEEMGRVLDCDPTTVGRRFGAEIATGSAHLKIRLRRQQIKAAMAGNITMLIWLGKQLLDQTDRNRTELTGKVENPGALSAEELDARIRNLLKKAGYAVEADFDRAGRIRIPAAAEGEIKLS